MAERQVFMGHLSETMVYQTSAEFKVGAEPDGGPTELVSRAQSHGKRIDDFCTLGTPLDYSYMDLMQVSDLLHHEPASGVRKQTDEEKQQIAAAKQTEGGNEIKMSTADKGKNGNGGRAGRRRIATGIRLSYNNLTTLDGLEEVLERVLEDPVKNLQMIDLSHNRLPNVDAVLLKYPNLSVIYLHGNEIVQLSELNKLNALSKLSKITLMGNCREGEKPGGGRLVKRIEDIRYYRQQVIYRLKDCELRSMDVVPITPKDRENALLWNARFRPPPRVKEEKTE